MLTGMPRIVTLTLNPALDLSAEAEEVVHEHKIRCENARFDPGGGGVNVARVLTRFGVPCVAVYPSGGLTGQLLGQLLDGEGVARRSLPAGGLTRESVTILERGTGHEFRFVLSGPTLEAAAAQACMEVAREIEPGGFVVASGSLPPGVDDGYYARLADVVAEQGARYVVDTSGPALRMALERGLWLAKPNRRELEELTGRAVPDGRAVAEAARALVASGRVEVLVVSLGAEGALLTNAETQLVAAPPPVEVRSAVGAGDSFTAGLVTGVTRGEPLERAFARAVASGTAALLTPGTELCRPEDAERLLAQVKVERV